MMDAKLDEKGPGWLSPEDQLREIGRIGDYGHGDYVSPCSACGRRFIGDKRARQCLPCAIKALSASTQGGADELALGVGHEGPHARAEDCPTFYDGCHCTVETLIHNIDRATKAEAALTRHRAKAGDADGWLPIESAPKDGSDQPFQLLFEEARVSTAYYDAYYDKGGFGYDPRHDPWIEPISAEQLSRHYGKPTHWRPLPAPPRAAIASMEQGNG